MTLKNPEPRGLLSTVIGWIIVIVVITYLIDILSSILLLHWKVILIAILLFIGAIALWLYQRRKDRWY